MAKTNIKIKPSKRGTFTAAAKKRGKGVQAFASQVLSNKEAYSPAMVKKANFARNASKWKHAYGGQLPSYGLGGDVFAGATSGLASGAALGPWGALGGTILGGVSGLMAGKAKEDAFNQQQENMRVGQVRQARLAGLQPQQNYASAIQYPDGGQVLSDTLSNAGSLPLVQDPIQNSFYLKDLMKGNIKGYKAGKVMPIKKGSEVEKNIRGSYKYPYNSYVEITNDKGKTSYFPVLETPQFDELVKQRGLTSKDVNEFPDGGTVSPELKSEYADKITGLDHFLWNNYLGGRNISFSDMSPMQVQMLQTRQDILNEVPSTLGQINQGDPNEVKYLNDVMGRLDPYLTKENADMLMKSNNPINMYKKAKFVSDLPLYKADVDSLQKYMPEFYDKNNLQLAKPFLSGEAIPEYAQGGMAPLQDIEVEGGESLVTPDGMNANMEGPTHADGGIPMSVEPGTKIFSDRVEDPETGKTFSDLNKKVTSKMNKYHKILEDADSTPIARRTAERMLNKLQGQQDALFVSQERVKLAENKPKKTNKFPHGGVVTQEDIENAINLSFDNLKERYLKDTVTGLGDYKSPGMTRSYNTLNELEKRRTNVLDRFRGSEDLTGDPQRLTRLYNSMIANGIIQGEPVGAPQQQSTAIAGSQALGNLSYMASPIERRRARLNNQLPPVYNAPSKNEFVDSLFGDFLPNSSGMHSAYDVGVDTDSYLQALDGIQGDNLMGPTPDQASYNEALQGIQGSNLAGITPDEASYNQAMAGISGDNLAGPSMQTMSSFAPTLPSAGLPSSTNLQAAGYGYQQQGASPEQLTQAYGPNTQGTSQAGGFGNALTTVAQFAPALYNIGQGLFGKAEEMNPNDYSNIAGQVAAAGLRDRRYNARPELDAVRRAAASGRRNITNASRTRGELLSNLGGLSATQGAQEARVLANKQNIENQYASEAAQMTAQLGAQDAATRLQAADYNARSRASQQGMLGTGLSQLSGALQALQQRRGQRRADDMRVSAYNSMFSNYQINPVTGQIEFKRV